MAPPIPQAIGNHARGTLVFSNHKFKDFLPAYCVLSNLTAI